MRQKDPGTARGGVLQLPQIGINSVRQSGADCVHFFLRGGASSMCYMFSLAFNMHSLLVLSIHATRFETDSRSSFQPFCPGILPCITCSRGRATQLAESTSQAGMLVLKSCYVISFRAGVHVKRCKLELTSLTALPGSKGSQPDSTLPT